MKKVVLTLLGLLAVSTKSSYFTRKSYSDKRVADYDDEDYQVTVRSRSPVIPPMRRTQDNLDYETDQDMDWQNDDEDFEMDVEDSDYDEDLMVMNTNVNGAQFFNGFVFGYTGIDAGDFTHCINGYSALPKIEVAIN